VQQEIDVKHILDEAGGYKPEAYRFIRDGLAHTVQLVHGREADEEIYVFDEDDESRHISGQQLCLGLRDFAIRQYGLLARMVLNKWGIRRTEDFGRIVFAMVDAGLMRKTEEDTIHDFENVFEFEEEFRSPGDLLHERRRADANARG